MCIRDRYWDYVDDELLAEKHGKCRVTFYLEESESGFSTLAPVSYTHLDVYKRQIIAKLGIRK